MSRLGFRDSEIKDSKGLDQIKFSKGNNVLHIDGKKRDTVVIGLITFLVIYKERLFTPCNLYGKPLPHCNNITIVEFTHVQVKKINILTGL